MCLLPFLWTGMIKEIFHCFGTSANSIEQLKINQSEYIIDGIAELIGWDAFWSDDFIF